MPRRWPRSAGVAVLTALFAWLSAASGQVPQTRTYTVTDVSGKRDSTMEVVVPTEGGVLYYRSGGEGRTALVRDRRPATEDAARRDDRVRGTVREATTSQGISRLDLLEMENRILNALNRRSGTVAPSRSTDPFFVPQATSPLVVILPDGQRLAVGGSPGLPSDEVIPTSPMVQVIRDTVRVQTPSGPIFVQGPERLTVEEVERAILDTGLFRTTRVQFEFAKSTLLPTALDVLDVVGQVLLRYPDLRIAIHGHTDSRGSDATNDRLSGERASSARSYLLSMFPSINATRIESEGFGKRQPIATNDTETGRALNRRVEFIPLNPGAAVRTRSTTRIVE